MISSRGGNKKEEVRAVMNFQKINLLNQVAFISCRSLTAFLYLAPSSNTHLHPFQQPEAQHGTQISIEKIYIYIKQYKGCNLE